MAKRQASIPPPNVNGDAEDLSMQLWNPQLSNAARALLTSAVRCFAANGYHATTTRDISSGVGLSPAALYVHFPSKELVLYEIIRTGHEKALELLQTSTADRAGDAEDRLRDLITDYTAWHARHHVIARVCQYDLSGLAPDHYAVIRDLRRRTNEVFRKTVAAGVDEGNFAGADINRVVRGMLSMSIDLVRWYRLDGVDSPESLGAFYAELALRMVRFDAKRPKVAKTAPQPRARAAAKSATAATPTTAKTAARPAKAASARPRKSTGTASGSLSSATPQRRSPRKSGTR